MAKRLTTTARPSAEQAAFLNAIIDNPADDTPRLVFADWLDEHGDPDRARLIRLQVEAARRPRQDQSPESLAEEEAILDRRRAEWLAELGLVAVTSYEPTFHRGFVAAANLTAAEFLRIGESLTARTPLVHLGLTGIGDRVRKLAGCPALGRLRSLSLADAGLDDRAVQHLAESPHIRGLERLDLGFNRIGPAGVRAILGTGVALADVGFEGNQFGPEGAAAVAGSPAMARHLTLRLGGNGIGPAGARAVAESPYLGAVVDADLRENRLGVRGARALAGSVSLRPRRLRLLGNGLGNRGSEALATGPLAEGVESLDLEANRVGGPGVRAVARSARLGRLRWLDLTDNPVPGAAALALRDGLPGLAGLCLDGTDVGERVLMQLFGRAMVMGELVGRGRDGGSDGPRGGASDPPRT